MEGLRELRVAPALPEVPVLLLAVVPLAPEEAALLRPQPQYPCAHLAPAAWLDPHPYHWQRETTKMTTLALAQVYRP